MPNIHRIQAIWTGFPGSPGYTTWYFDATTTTKAVQMRNFFVAIAAQIPSNTVVQVQSQGDILDDATGIVNGVWTESAVASVAGTGSGAYTSVAGAVINWLTAAFVGGRRLRGRTFLVPLRGAAYDSDGSIAATILTALQTAAAAVVTASGSSFLVWHRPVGGSGGSSAAVTTSLVPDKSVTLRSRRD